jgi:hypothetical protein
MTQDNMKIKSIQGIVTSSDVGVVLNLSVYFGKAVIFPHSFSINIISMGKFPVACHECYFYITVSIPTACGGVIHLIIHLCSGLLFQSLLYINLK